MDDSNGTPTPTDQEMLKVFLAERDAECPVCRYNVKNLNSRVCPECGSSLELQLGSSDLHLLPWIVAVLSSALPAGFYLIVSIITLYFWITEGPPPFQDFTWLMWFYGLAILTTLICLLLIKLRRKFIRKTEDQQKRLALIIGLVCGGSVLVYMTAFIVFNSL